MDDMMLLEKIANLPTSLKTEVADFVDFLIAKKLKVTTERKPVFGSAKGMFIMMPDFDEPLEDFEKYM